MNPEPSHSDEPQGRTPLESQLRRMRPVPLRVSAEDLLRAAADQGAARRESADAAPLVHTTESPSVAPSQWAALAVACLGGVAIGAVLAVLLSPSLRGGRLDAAAAPPGPTGGASETRSTLDAAVSVAPTPVADAATPDAATPDALTPDAATPDAATPDAAAERSEPALDWSPSDWRVAGQLGELRDSHGGSAPLSATSHVWPQRQRPDRRPVNGLVSRSESLPDERRGPVSRPIRSSDSDLLLQELFRL